MCLVSLFQIMCVQLFLSARKNLHFTRTRLVVSSQYIFFNLKNELFWKIFIIIQV